MVVLGGGHTMNGGIYMSIKELSRLEIIMKLQDKAINQLQAAEALGISIRQVKRLVRQYRDKGPEGLISKKRAKRGNHILPEALKILVCRLIQSHYPDYGPTLAHEKLTEEHDLRISISSVRSLMVANEIWVPRRVKKQRIFQYRERRSQEGELMQIDGSPHDWLEGRGVKCTLMYTLDDATGKIQVGRFCPSETVWDYYHLLRAHVSQYGRPLALYSDKHSVFRVNRKGALSGDGITQFGKAMKKLGIEMIFANTPQAKGRIERANKTLQDRLVKELRAHQITTLDEANAFLPIFIEDYNRRFAVIPKNPNNAHRQLLPEHKLDQIFTITESRHLSKNLTFQHKNTIYQVQTTRESYALRKAHIEVYEKEDGTIEALYKGTKLKLLRYDTQERQENVADSKQVNHLVDLIKNKPTRKPWKKHPWRRSMKQDDLMAV